MAMKQPHVVIFPFPLQGHMKPLLCLAELLCHASLHATYVNTHHNHERLANRQALSTHFPTLHFESISDGLPEDDPRTLSSQLLIALKTSIRPHFRELLKTISLKAESNDTLVPPPSCITTVSATFPPSITISCYMRLDLHKTLYLGVLWVQ
ncbi:hypothetical protein CerSpe_225750 [Prunus speciosa]